MNADVFLECTFIYLRLLEHLKKRDMETAIIMF